MPGADALTSHEWEPGTLQPHCWRDPARLTAPEIVPGPDPHRRHLTCCVCQAHFFQAEATIRQLECLASDAHPLLILGSPGGGKSTVICRKLLMAAWQIPGSVWMLGRYEEEELKETTLITFAREAERLTIRDRSQALNIIAHWQKSEGKLLLHTERYCQTRDPHDLATIYTIGLKKGLGSWELTGFAVDHAEEISEHTFHQLMDRCRIPPDAPFQGVLAAYAPEKTHWLFRFFGEGDEELGIGPGPYQDAVLSLPLDDNPYVSEKYKANVRARYAHNPALARRYLEARWGLSRRGDPVFPEFRAKLHGIPWHVAGSPLRPNPALPVDIGFDYGLTPAVSWTQVDPHGRWLLFDAVATSDSGLERFLPQIKARHERWWHGFLVRAFGDPSGEHRSQVNEATCVQLIRRVLGWTVKPGIRELAPGVEPIRAKLRESDPMLGTPLLLVDPRNRLVIDAFEGGYCKDKDGQPQKNHPYSDIMDALRYIGSRIFKPYDDKKLRALYQPDPNVRLPGWYGGVR